MRPGQAEAMQLNETRDPSLLVAVTLSGGGARAAAFGFGVLSELRDTAFHWRGRVHNLLDATDVISGVSGGSIIAAYYAAFGVEGLWRFEHDFLRQNFQQTLTRKLLRPGALLDLSSPWYGRSNLLERDLHRLYRGLTFDDLKSNPRHPQLIVSATDLTLGTGFEFTSDQFALICSDLGSVPLSFAVASSAAVPLLLSPLAVRNYADRCAPGAAKVPQSTSASGALGDYRKRLYRAHAYSYLDASKRPYIHLVDGGLADNLGVQRLLDRALMDGGLRQTFSEVVIPPGSIQKVVLVVVNAERDPSHDISASDTVPSVLQVADALLFGAGSRATLETQEFLLDVIQQWRQEMGNSAQGGGDAFAPGAVVHAITANLRDVPDPFMRQRLLRVRTAFTVDQAEVTDLIEAGRAVLRNSPEFQALVRSLGAWHQPIATGAGD